MNMLNLNMVHLQWRDDKGRAKLWIEFDDTVPVGLVRGADGYWRVVAPSRQWIAEWFAKEQPN